MDKITKKLTELKQELTEMKQLTHREGRDRYYAINDLLDRIIGRTFPEKHAASLKKKLHRSFAFGQDDEALHQKEYVDDINRSIRTIDTIQEECELFGLEDFEPVKTKVETEVGVKTGIFNAKRTWGKEKKK